VPPRCAFSWTVADRPAAAGRVVGGVRLSAGVAILESAGGGAAPVLPPLPGSATWGPSATSKRRSHSPPNRPK
jgi:hypothetical protein